MFSNARDQEIFATSYHAPGSWQTTPYRHPSSCSSSVSAIVQPTVALLLNGKHMWRNGQNKTPWAVRALTPFQPASITVPQVPISTHDEIPV